MANLTASIETDKVGFMADFVLGPRGEDATFLSPDLRPGGSSNIVNQLYAYWNMTDKLTATIGNFNTFLGYEVISPTGNFNYSTSYMFSYGPFSHTGLKVDIATEEVGDRAMFIVNLYNTDSSFVGQKYFWRGAPLSNTPKDTYQLSFLNNKNIGMLDLMLVISRGGTAHFGNIDVSYSSAESGNKEWTTWIDSFVHICKNNSIKAAEVDWDEVDRKRYSRGTY